VRTIYVENVSVLRDITPSLEFTLLKLLIVKARYFSHEVSAHGRQCNEQLRNELAQCARLKQLKVRAFRTHFSVQDKAPRLRNESDVNGNNWRFSHVRCFLDDDIHINQLLFLLNKIGVALKN